MKKMILSFTVLLVAMMSASAFADALLPLEVRIQHDGKYVTADQIANGEYVALFQVNEEQAARACQFNIEHYNGMSSYTWADSYTPVVNGEDNVWMEGNDIHTEISVEDLDIETNISTQKPFFVSSESAGLYKMTIDLLSGGVDALDIVYVSSAKGDVNNDGAVNIVDALLISQYYVGTIGEDDLILDAADVNCDGAANVVDSLLISQYYVGSINSLDCE